MMKAFFGDATVKDKYVTRLEQHHEQDDFIRGDYGSEVHGSWRGCAVGCTIHGEDHFKYETEIGIPWRLAVLHDTLFENVSEMYSQDFAMDFLKVIPVGADLSLVAFQLFKVQVMRFKKRIKSKELRKWFNDFMSLLDLEISGEQQDPEKWHACQYPRPVSDSLTVSEMDIRSALCFFYDSLSHARTLGGNKTSMKNHFSTAFNCLTHVGNNSGDGWVEQAAQCAESLLRLMQSAPVVPS